MAFKTQMSPSRAYEQAKSTAISARNMAASRSVELQSTTNRDVLTGVASDFRGLKDSLDSFAAVPGIAQYARDQEDDQTYDVVAEFTAMGSAIEAVISEIVTAFPTEAGGALIERRMNADGTVAPLTFTPGQLASIRGLLDAVVAAIVL